MYNIDMENSMKNLANKSQEEIEKTFNLAMNVLFFIELSIILGAYLVARHFSVFGADCGLVVVMVMYYSRLFARDAKEIKRKILEKIHEEKKDKYSSNASGAECISNSEA